MRWLPWRKDTEDHGGLAGDMIWDGPPKMRWRHHGGCAECGLPVYLRFGDDNEAPTLHMFCRCADEPVEGAA